MSPGRWQPEAELARRSRSCGRCRVPTVRAVVINVTARTDVVLTVDRTELQALIARWAAARPRSARAMTPLALRFQVAATRVERDGSGILADDLFDRRPELQTVAHDQTL